MLRWFLSRKVRQATNLCRHVQRLVNAQRDQLRAEAVEKIAAAVAAVRAALAFNADKRLLEERMADLEKATARWLKFHPHASVRENVEVILVAVAIAVAIHTFFLKPFKIPTGSMQPTLCGITADELGDNPDVEIPTGLKKFFDYWIYGISYSLYRQGDRVLKTRVFAGDHLFVDRLSYNFRRPKRGEIIVFKTEGIRSSFPPPMPQDHYFSSGWWRWAASRFWSGTIVIWPSTVGGWITRRRILKPFIPLTRGSRHRKTITPGI